MIYAFPELYDEQYERYRDDFSFYRSLAEDYGSPVLELGAGTGRVSMSLAKAGFAVTGIDLSDEMLQKAKTRIQEAKLEDLINLEQQDMRTLELGERFPLVIAPFNALMHLYTLKDQDKAFAAIKRHLQSDGVFAFDLYNPNFETLDHLTKQEEWSTVGGQNAELFLYQTQDKDKQIVNSTYYLDSISPDGSLKRQTAQLKQRYYYRFELERALQHAGFSQVRFFGDFDRQPYSRAAPHLIGIAKP